MNANQKGTALVGGALTDEAMESSDSILAAGSYGVGQKGLQQFYSPPEAARLAARVMGDRIAVLDPTAGDGSLLKEFNPTNSYGVEIDRDQIKNAEGGYNPIRGDFQHVYTLLRLGMQPWAGIVANPPFGLQWSDPTIRDEKATNSTVFTFIAINRLLADDGQYMFICGRNRYDRQIARLAEHRGAYAVIECDDLFEGTREPCVIVFGIHEANRSPGSEGILGRRTIPRDMLDLTADWIEELREKALGDHNYIRENQWGTHHLPEQLKAIQQEYDRRVEKRIKNREFDAQLYNGDHIQWYPSAYAKQALQQAGLLSDFHGLNGQPVQYFSQNERLWFKLGEAEERGLITIDPRLRVAVGAILGDIQKHRIPLYALKPQQRLGFLDDIDSLRCIRDDPERHFKKGEVYRLDTNTATLVEKETRIVEMKTKPGEYTEKTYEKHKKVMRLTLTGGGAHYSIVDGGDDATQNISWLISHFDIPDPGEISSRHPEEIAALEKLVREVLEEFQTRSAAWEEKHQVSMPFSVRDFQVNDIARLLFKGFGICAWEQGLGKTVGALAFYRAATKLNAKKKLLITCPGDLKDQWMRECERFLGKTPEVITNHGQAKKIANHLRKGGTGAYIVHYEAMAINGTLRKNNKLPVITVKEWQERELVRGTDRWAYWYWYRESDNRSIGPYNLDAVKQVVANHPEAIEVLESGFYMKTSIIDAMEAEGFVQKTTKSYQVPDTGDRVAHSYVRPRWENKTKKLTSRDICPECHADTRNGWNGTFCEATKKDGKTCGYAHYAVRMKPIASLLTTAFHDGVVVLDEITYIQGNDSKRSKAMRGVQARYRLGLSGTPIKNYVNQIFWPLAWCLGYEKPWFPYSYDGGMTRFEADFCVIEYATNGNRKETRKTLPDVTNLSRFWRMVSSHNIRRRQEETGEDLVDIYYHEVKVPLGLSQAEQTKEWLKKLPHGFPAFFAEKYPDAPVVKAGMHEIMAPLLGLNWKLDYAATVPKGDPDHEWTDIEVSNFTPANLKVLELTMALVKQGRKVLVGSHIVSTGKWLADRLNEKDVKALHIVDESGTTVEAKKRGEKVYDFQTNPDIQVFCAGMKAIRLGHNLDAADAVVINGLDFDYETLDQFVKRVRRLTSVNDVDVFVLLPTLQGQDTITTRKWQLLGLKSNAADLALDGRLVEKNEAEISEQEMIRELQDRGLTVTDEAVEEADVEAVWERIPALDEFDAEGVLPDRPTLEEPDEPETTQDEPDAAPEEPTEEAEVAEEAPAEDEAPEDEDDSWLDEAIEESWLADADEPVEDEDQVANATNSSHPSPTPLFGVEGAEPEATASAEEGHGSEPLAGVTSGVQITPTVAAPSNDTEPTSPADADAVNSDLVLVGTVEDTEPEGDEALPLTPAAPAPSLDFMGQLKQAAELHQLGVLSDEEFASIKREMLAGLGVAA